MRRLRARPTLTQDVLDRLNAKTQEILALQVALRVERARQIYNTARGTDWFRPVIDALRGLCGNGELCMYCSSNEPSQLEHYRPLSSFPEHAMAYPNYLWSCDICNRTHKGEKFPPDTGPGEMILNPLDDDVWEYFFIDDTFGRLLKRVDLVTNLPLGRATSTCDIVGIDRENVQEKRSRRYKNLRRDANEAVRALEAGTLTVDVLRNEIADWRTEPFQADVADYFLNGPGRSKEPFRSVLRAAGETV